MEESQKKIILNEIVQNWEDAKSAKVSIDQNISRWMDVYNGKPYGNEQKARAKIVVRDVYKTVESLKPNISEPFIGSAKTVDAIPYTAAGEESTDASERLLNYQFQSQLDRRSLMNNTADVLAREGTVWLKSGWVYTDEEFDVPMTVPKQALQMIPDEYEIVEDLGDSVSILVKQVDITKNEPTLKLCRNEHIYPDPTAESDDDMQYLVYEYTTTMSNLKQENVYDNLDLLEAKLSTDYEETALGSERDATGRDQGRDRTYGFKDKARKKITIMEYWGYYDLNDDGIAEPVLIVWDKKNKVLLRMEENPMPHKEIPFQRSVYIEEPFSLWGKALADAMEDGQKIHTAIMRGIIDNMSLANNGQKFIMKGGMDQMNFRRMVGGEKHIYMNQNPNEVMMDGAYNELPSSAFNVYEMVETLNEGITGISRMNQGLDGGAMTQTATGVSTLTSMSQRRMLDTVRNLSNMLRKLFRQQLINSIEFLDDEEWMRLTGRQKPQGELGKDFDIQLQLITDAVKQSKIGQFNLMLQNLQYVGEGTQFEVGNLILGKYFDLFDEPTIADKIRQQQPPQPDPMAQQQMQLEMQKLQAEVQKLQAESQKTMSEAQVVGSESEVAQMEAQMDMQAKQQDMQMGMMEAQQKSQVEMESAQQGLAIDARRSEQQMGIAEDKAALDMLLAREKGKNDMMLSRQKTTADIASKKAMAAATPKPKG